MMVMVVGVGYVALPLIIIIFGVSRTDDIIMQEL